MTILREIHAWSKGLVAWQQDAIARLYADRVLSELDIADLYALAKAAYGIPDPDGRVPSRLQDAEVAPPPDPARLVQLAAIKDVTYVNALADGARLPLASSGLSVIYGENGAGKSGYSRVLKHACRARSRSEVILPDAKLDPKQVGTPRAVFEALIDGELIDLAWVYGQTAPAPLADVSIFDSHCARAYIDNNGEFAYVPYGLDILEGLVALCDKLKAKANAEALANTPTNAVYAALLTERTAVAAVLNNIPAKTKAADVEALAAWTAEDQSRLDVLERTLAEADPKAKAQALKEREMRLAGLKTRLKNALDAVSEQTLDNLRDLISKQAIAMAAAELAAEGFKAMPGQLPGTGGDEWQALFRAAREFAALSHRDHRFPNLLPESSCPLCQNQLGQAGADRLKQFDVFIEQQAERNARAARQAAKDAYRAVDNAVLDLGLQNGLKEELEGIDPALAGACLAYETALSARQAEVRLAAGSKLAWEEVAALPEDLRPTLDTIIQSLQIQAKALIDSADEKGRPVLMAEKSELAARRALLAIKDAVLEVIAKHELSKKLRACAAGMSTAAISRKSTELAGTMARDEVAEALKDELTKLKVNELNVVMKPVSQKGRPQFKLVLELPGGANPAAVLSEGEQRAIALASFLTEIRLARGKGGVVFDDPVSSLDHRRRWEVAARLVSEAQIRQVIVFTHDIYFLCIVEQMASEAGTPWSASYIRRTPKGFGVHTDDLPFDVLSTSKRVGRLRVALQEIRAAKKAYDDDRLRKLTTDAYGDLRLAWERAVEEVLFNGTIQRFGEGVSTQLLKAVTVTDDDYRAINAGMTKASKFEHDAAVRVARLPLPDVEELSEDIERLEAWRKSVDDRLKVTRKAREAA